jgi:hypothetical protein
MTADNLAQVVKIIQRNEPSLKDQNPEELEIDFAVLRNETCRELQRFIKAMKSKATKARNNPSGAKRPGIAFISVSRSSH